MVYKFEHMKEKARSAKRSLDGYAKLCTRESTLPLKCATANIKTPDAALHNKKTVVSVSPKKISQCRLYTSLMALKNLDG